VRHRYLRKDINGTVMETPEELFRRVAYTVAAVEAPRIPNLRINCMKYLLPKKQNFLEGKRKKHAGERL
jgi:ribonucleotide reductase alpha subunit